MSIRRIVLLAVACSLTMVPVAGAAPKPKPVCNLVVDAPGDAGPFKNAVPVPPLQDPSLDILSADIATDAKNLTTVIRVRKLTKVSDESPTGSNQSPAGRAWAFSFTMNGKFSGTNVSSSPVAGTTYGASSNGAFDTTKNEVRITLPWSTWGAVPTPGTVLSGFSVATFSELGQPSQLGAPGAPIPGGGGEQDNARSEAIYKVGTPSCVAVGK